MRRSRKPLAEPAARDRKREDSSPDYPAMAYAALKASGDAASSKLPPALYVVATPIGHLGDITLRALATLARADIIACEDTRVTGSLLKRYGLAPPQLVACHDHNERARMPGLVSAIAEGHAVALVSDAGTPLVSDPGFPLVRACREADLPVIPVPGASALLAALSAAGLPAERFLFAGFLPAKDAARRDTLKTLADIPATLIFYESPQRLSDTLTAMRDMMPSRHTAPSSVARELTKMFEEIRHGALPDLAAYYQDAPPPKGEVVILIGPPDETATRISDEDLDHAILSALQTMRLSEAVDAVTAATDLPRRTVYQRALALKP